MKRLLIKVYKTLFHILSFMPKNKKLIVFESFLGKQYSDNPRAMYEYMKEHYPQYKMIWSVDRRYINLFEEKEVRYVKRLSVKWLFTMTRAGYWVTNSRLPNWLTKSQKTTYVQTWHGTPLKRLANDMDEVHMPGTDKERYKRNFTKEASKWDYLVSPNRYSTDIFRRAFQFNNAVVESGYPRNDFLVKGNNADTIKRLRKSMGLPEDKKIILYAPTWRDNQYHSKGKYKFELQLDIEQLKEQLGDDYIILFRMHYLVADKMDLNQYRGFAYDFSNYEDLRNLYLVSDLLVTDYSSVFFDYSILNRPILFFTYDLEEYRDQLRGFYFDFEKDAPGKLVNTTQMLINEINSIDKQSIKELQDTYEEFRNKYCSLEDGSATERVVEKVFKRSKQ